MKINLLNIDEFIKSKQCKEIKNAIYFNFGNIPTDDGLFSYEIFGPLGSDSRKTTWAYIDLRRKFIHPIAYLAMIRLNKKLSSVIHGTMFVKINKFGEIEEDNENGETGIDFLYNNWEKIVWTRTSSFKRDDKIILLTKLPKDRIFIDKWLVMPPFLRDFTPSEDGRMESVDEVNDYYVKLIRLSQSLDLDGMSFNFQSNNTNALIEETLYNIYSYCTSQLAKKNGLIHKGLLAKNVDFATRSVVSCSMTYSDSYKSMEIPFSYTGIPISQLITLFNPFFIHEIQAWFSQYEDSIMEELKKRNITIKPLMEQFSEEKIVKYMDMFIQNPESRFQSLKLETTNGDTVELALFKDDLKRPFSLMDLFFITAKTVCNDKHVYITRYPITQYESIYPSRIKILSTIKTTTMRLGDKYYEDYPLYLEDYPLKENDSTYFVDTSRMNSATIKAMTCDFDGDTISLRAVYTQEANQEAEEIINSPTFLLNSKGKPSRTFGHEAVQCIYSFTF